MGMDTGPDAPPAARYLQPGGAVDCDHARVRALADEIGGAKTAPREVARRLFRFVRDEVRYTPYAPFFLPAHYRASLTLARGRGYCAQKAVVLCALARAAGIASRLVFADIRNHRAPENIVAMMGTDVFTWHSYTELWLDGRWLAATPAFDRGLCEANDYPLVEFDGRHDAVFVREDDGRPFVDYLVDHGSFADVPLERLLAGWEAGYGRERVAAWKAMAQRLLGA